jgi:hypothetical protein
MSDKVCLVASDGERFEVDKKIAQQSELVKSMTEEASSAYADSTRLGVAAAAPRL